MYKLTRLNGRDFYSDTVDYAGSIGKIIRVADYDISKEPCGKGLHASRNPNDCFVGAKIPCRAFKVEGIGKLAGDTQKSRYKALKIITEIEDLDTLFGWKYSEAINPIHPFKINSPKITEAHKQLVNEWASVWASVKDSVVKDSVVWASVIGASVWDSVEASVKASVGASVWASVVGASVWASVWAYLGSLFPNIKSWKYIKHKKGVYPYKSCDDLWRQGLVPSYNGKTWRLHGMPEGKILIEFNEV